MFLSLYSKITALLNSEEGQGMAEYGLIIALVALAVVVALTALGGNLTSLFTRISGALGGSAG